MPGKGSAPCNTPARGYSWPPFEPGNKVARQHGAYDVDSRFELAELISAATLDQRPDLGCYPAALAAWAVAEAVAHLFRINAVKRGLFDADGNPLPAQADWRSWERLAAQHRSLLGLDPKGEAELRKTRADAQHAIVDLEALAAQGREVLQARVIDAEEQPRALAAALRHEAVKPTPNAAPRP